MKYKSTLYAVTTLCVMFMIGNIYLLTNITKKNKQINSCASVLNGAKKEVNSLKKYFLKRNQRCINSEGIFISDSIKVKEINQTSHLLIELVDEPFNLVFYFDKSNCATCIETEIERQKEYFSDIEDDKIIILISGMNKREIEYFQKSKQINFRIYQIEREQLNLPINEFNVPFLFLLTPNGLTRSVFIPELNEKKFSDDYYSHIRNLIFNSYIDCL